MDTFRRSDAGAAVGLFMLLIAAQASCRSACGGCEEQRRLTTEVETLRRLRMPVEASPSSADIDDEGRAFLVAGGRGPIQVWSTEGSDGGAPVALPSSGAVVTAQFVKGGGVFFAFEDGSAGIWSWKDQRSLFGHRFHRRGRHAAIDDAGRFVAFDGVVLDRETGQEAGPPKSLTTQSALGMARGGSRAAMAGFHEPWIVVRDLPAGTVREWIAPDKVRAVAVSDRGDLLAVSTRDGELHLWKQPGGEKLRSWNVSDEVRTLSFLEGDARLFLADARGIAVCEVATSRRLLRREAGGRVLAAAVDGSVAATGTEMGTVAAWDLERGTLLGSVNLDAAVTALAVNATHRLLLGADERGEIILSRWR
jgi:WD40 repeat protein